MQPDSLKDQVAELVKRAGSVAELARLSLVSERSIRNYLSGDIRPNGKVLDRLNNAAREAEKRRAMLGAGGVQAADRVLSAAEHGGEYRSVNLKTLSAAIFEVESRVPLLAPEAKAGLIAACYEHMNNAAPGSASIGDFADLITGAAAAGRTLPKPLSDEDLEEARTRQGQKKK